MRRIELSVPSVELAKLMGLDLRQLSETEAGRRNLTALELFLASNTLMVEPSYFFQDLKSSIPIAWKGDSTNRLGKPAS